MQRVPAQTGAPPDDSNLRFREPTEDDSAARDDTTVSFDGLMKVSADEGGGDPYNRTGSFKRLVR